jgi:flagellar biosynthesis anti-sigma factor FlgM
VKIDKSAKSTAATPIQSGGHSSSSQPTTSRAPKGGSPLGNGATSGTQVHIGAANQLQGAIAAAPALDMNKVAAVRQAISEGRFQVNAHAVASGLIHSVRQLVQTQK